MENLELTDFQTVELNPNELKDINGGCIGWLCVGHLWEAANEFNKMFNEGWNDFDIH